MRAVAGRRPAGSGGEKHGGRGAVDWDVEPTSVSPMADFDDDDVVASTKVMADSGVIDVGAGDDPLFDEASVDDLLNSLAVGTDERRHDGVDLRGVIAGPSLRPRQPVPAPPRRAAAPARPTKRPTVPPPGPLRKELRAPSDTDVRRSSAPAVRASSAPPARASSAPPARASAAPAARAPSLPEDADTQLVEAPDFGVLDFGDDDALDPVAPHPVAAEVAPERSARHSSQPPQAEQVPFRPVLPYPMPEQFTGPVPYATAPGAAVPYASGAYPVMATGLVAVQSRSKVPLIMCLVGAVGIGIGVGAILFARGGATAVPAAAPAPAAQAPAAPAQPAPAQAVPAVAPGAGPTETVTQAAAEPTEPAVAADDVAADAAAAAEPSAPRTLTLEVASLEHAAGEPLHAPVRGVVGRVLLTEPRLVKKNEALFEITRRLPASPKAAALAKRVKELEVLAKTDPEYKAFLERARRDHKRAAQVRTEKVVVRAARAGMITAVAKRGAQVGPDDVLATVADPSSWVVRASLTGEERPTSEWSCRIVPVEAAAEQDATCRVAEIAQPDGDGAQVVATVEASAAPWLEGGGEQKLRLVVEPPPGSP